MFSIRQKLLDLVSRYMVENGCVCSSVTAFFTARHKNSESSREGATLRSPGPCRCPSQRLCVAVLLAGLCACASSPPYSLSQKLERYSGVGQEGVGQGDRQRRLADLALLYDDTIVTQSARTVDFNGQSIVPRFSYTESEKGDRDLRVRVATTRFVFGLNENLTLGLTIPYVNKSLERSNPSSGMRETLRSDGLGDVPVMGKYRFFQKSGAGETTEAAVIFGLELPSGRTNVEDGGSRLSQPLQPGSGSLDAILGVAFTRVDGRWLLNADLIGKFNTEADDYRFGNTYRFDVGAQYRVYPGRYESFDQTTVNLVAELNSSYAEQSTFQGATLPDTGGLKVFATPGIQVIVSENMLFEGAIQIPVIRSLRGSQLEEKFRIIFGLRARF